MWQQAPESGLDPNNESGPVPFTSSALLGVAYIRLNLNIGSYRKLESRDHIQIASELERLPKIERNGCLFSALLYATHALSVPVRLGIDRIARSQAFFWSVQHALSGFECAVFLAKWLCSWDEVHEASPVMGIVRPCKSRRSVLIIYSRVREQDPFLAPSGSRGGLRSCGLRRNALGGPS
jgi:hypothetical protein